MLGSVKTYALILCLAISGCPAPQVKPDPPTATAADVVLTHGIVYQVDPDTVAQMVAIKGDRILAVGSAKQAKRWIGANTKVVDLKGRFVMPGFHDAHTHFEGGGRSLATLNLSGTTSLQQVLNKVAAHVKKTPKGQWIVGRGWDHTLWADEQQRWPTRVDLDAVSPLHPVYLSRVDGHVAWVNSAALRLAGITRRVNDPPGGVIERDSQGEPNGILKEKAMRLARPKNSPDRSRRDLQRALAQARKYGITSVQDGGASLPALEQLKAAGQLTARIHLWRDLDGDLTEYERLRNKHPRNDPWISISGLKGFVDGTLGSATAALLDPYKDRPASRGIVRTDETTLRDLIQEASERGFQVSLHAIGDRAVRLALHAYGALDQPRKHRHRLEHLQLVHPDDIDHFSRLGVIASFQPCHVSTDQRWATQRVGPQRAKERGYLWRTFERKGIALAFGTDWPVEPLDPLRNLFVAVTRRRVETPQEAGWYPQQRVDIRTAIRAYTYGSAFANFAEHQKGSLTPGKLADLVVLDRNLLTIEPADLLQTRVVATMVGGLFVYGPWKQ